MTTTPRFGAAHWIRRPSIWMCLLGTAMTAIAIQPPESEYFYAEISTARASDALFPIIMAMSAAMAWEISRFRHLIRSQLFSRPSIALWIICDRILPWATLAPLGYTVTLIYLGVWPAHFTNPSAWLMFVYATWVGIAFALIGAILGVALPPLASLSLTGLLSFGWLTVPPATHWTTLRHMTGDFTSCCSIDTVLSPRVPGAGALGLLGLLALTVTVGCLIIAATLRTSASTLLPTGTVAGLVATIAFFSSATIGNALPDYGSSIPRPLNEMVCTSSVCVWPEIADNRVKLNEQALAQFREIAPPQWKYLSNNPVTFDGVLPSGEPVDGLLFSGETSIEKILGDYATQIAYRELEATNTSLCGAPVNDYGLVSIGEPWDPHTPINPATAIARLENFFCPDIEAG